MIRVATKQIPAENKKTVDEVIAANVRRIREEKGLSVAELAERMTVGRHLIYDFERPRPGADQRQFLWRDVVNLCLALGVTVFDLALPNDGDYVLQEVGELGLPIRAPRDRDYFGELVFGVADLTPKVVEKIAQKQEDLRDARYRPFIEAARQLMEAVYGKEQLMEIDALYREAQE
jgi:transcriptional regulator with XRE-family HTH domain